MVLASHRHSYALVGDTEGNNAEYFLPLPLVHAETNRVGWNPVTKKKIRMQISGALMPEIDTIHNYKNNPHKFMLDKRLEKSLISRKFPSYFRPRRNDRDMVKITTIVEHIRKRFRRHTESQMNYPNLSNRRKSSGNRRRLARTTDINDKNQRFNPLTEQRNRETSSKSDPSRRHRRSAIEKILQNPWTMVPGLNSHQTREVNQEDRDEFLKSPSAPKFKECNDTTVASEVEDLNMPPSILKNGKIPIPFVEEIDFPEKRKLDDSSRKTNDPSGAVNYDSKFNQRKSPEKSQILMTSPPFSPKILGYVNLRDYQEQSKNENRSFQIASNASSPFLAYPKDIKPYNPDDIPYVEVPDYTDQREESLDEEDRRLANKERYRIVVKDVDEPITHEKDDYDEDVVDPGKSDASDVLSNPSKTQRTSGEDDESESTTDRYKDTNASGEERSDLTTDNPVDSNDNDRTNGKDTSLTKNEENIDNRSRSTIKPAKIRSDNDHADKIEEETKNSSQNNEESIFDFEPIHFELSNYPKPFDFHSLFENKRMRNDGISSQLKGGDESESLEIFSKPYKASATAKGEDFYFDDEEFFKPILEHKNDKFDRFHDAFPSRHFDDDVIDALGIDERRNQEKENSKKSLEKEKNDSYETLPMIVKTKNFRSQIGKLKARKKHEPGDYSKFWTLEYAYHSPKLNRRGHTNGNERIRMNKWFY